MNETCNDQEQCNRPLNHDGDHGITMPHMPGLIIAPRHNIGKEYPRELCALTCLSCDGPLEIGQAEHGGNFYCLTCDEVYSFDERGFTSKYVKIFPSSDPHKYKPELKQEFIADWRNKNGFMNEGRYLLGMATTTERDAGLKIIEGRITDWWNEDNQLAPKRHFWQFWRKPASVRNTRTSRKG